MLEGILVVCGGLVVGLFGHRLFHTALGLYGFVLGAAIGLLVVGPLGSLLLGALVVVVGGVLGALAVTLMERAAVFLVGAAVGWVVGLALGGLLGMGIAAPALAVLLAVLGGVAGFVAERLVVTVGTAFVGAWTAVCGGAAAAAGTMTNLQVLPDLGWTGAAEVVLVSLTLLFAATQLALEAPRQRTHAPRHA